MRFGCQYHHYFHLLSFLVRAPKVNEEGQHNLEFELGRGYVARNCWPGNSKRV